MISERLHLPANAVGLVPHRRAMLLIGELRESTPENAAGVSVIAANNPFLDSKGKLDGVCFVECLAQLTAASEGFNAKTTGDGIVRTGYLVGVNDFSIKGRAVIGDTLQLKMRKLLEMNNVVVAEGDVYVGGKCLASGKLKFYIAESAAIPAATASVEKKLAGSAAHPERGVMFGHILDNLKIAGVSVEAGTATGEFCFQKDFPGFDGHFPGNPILPGIVMVAMSKAVSEAVCGAPLLLSGLAFAKFTKLVLPGDAIKVTVSVKEAGGAYAVRAQLSSEGKTAATFDFSAIKESADNE